MVQEINICGSDSKKVDCFFPDDFMLLGVFGAALNETLGTYSSKTQSTLVTWSWWTGFGNQGVG